MRGLKVGTHDNATPATRAHDTPARTLFIHKSFYAYVGFALNHGCRLGWAANWKANRRSRQQNQQQQYPPRTHRVSPSYPELSLRGGRTWTVLGRLPKKDQNAKPETVTAQAVTSAPSLAPPTCPSDAHEPCDDNRCAHADCRRHSLQSKAPRDRAARAAHGATSRDTSML